MDHSLTSPISTFSSPQEFYVHDTPTLLTIIEASTPDKANETIYCSGFKHHFEVLYETTGHSARIHEVDASKRSQTQLVAAVDLCDGQEKELLLCYNRKYHMVRFDGYLASP